MKDLQFNRHRRLRQSETMRSMVRETELHTNDLIYPIFVTEGINEKNEVPSMPNVYQFSLDLVDKEIDEVVCFNLNFASLRFSGRSATRCFG